MFSVENNARMRFCDDLDVEMCACDYVPSLSEKKVVLKKLAASYYDEDKK